MERVDFSYSDVTHLEVMHLASRAIAAGADFMLLGPRRTMLRSVRPVVAVSAVRTGCGKSQTARYLSKLLSARGLRVAVDANGTITTKQVGTVAWWNSLNYDLTNPSPTGEFSTILLGLNADTKIWDTLEVNLQDSVSLSEINFNLYPYLRLKFDLTDSTFTTTEPMELKSVHFDYQPLSDVYVEREDFNFQQDSLLQGYPVTFDFKARNFGNLSADSLRLDFYLNGLDSLIYSPIVSVPADSYSVPVEYTLDTRGLLFENEIAVLGEQRKREYFYFNNLIDEKFFVARDSIRPIFDVKFDGQEIIDNDIVSSTPEVVITLEDNSPLPLDTTYFTLVHNNKPLRFYQPELSYDYNGP